MGLPLFTAIFLPFLLTPVVAFAGRGLRERTGWLALIVPVTCLTLLLNLTLQHAAGTRLLVELPWIPSLGLNLTLVIDGLSLFFGLVVSGMGVLVVFYAQHYLDSHYRHHGRFYAYLLLFMGAMLGTVFSGNVLLLFVFWELTGFASFLLIGFLHEKSESRDGARMALVVTVGTGLAMLAGLVLLGQEAGTYELVPLLNGALQGKSSGTLNVAFVLIAIGAFGKSAQFPFHFWLPNAMAAPTPVSAYLHSATMVKLGVFLIARIFPVFSGVELWAPLLVVVCFGTMLIGAVLALLSHDLKSILAYSTVSQLGFLMGYYGMASPQGCHGDLLHIANHVFYKGCLFMVAGIVDHATGTRDVRQLGGLARRMPLLLGITLVGSACMAGLPGTVGFISKEYMLQVKFDYLQEAGGFNWYPIILVVGSSLIKVAFAARIVWGVFGGAPRAGGHEFHAPGWGMQLPPLLLAGACLGFGIFPHILGSALERFLVPGLHLATTEPLSLWHGFTPAFMLSVMIVLAGGGLFAVLQRQGWKWAGPASWMRFDVGFEQAMRELPRAARSLSAALRFDRQFDFLALALAFTVLLIGGFWWSHRAALWPGLPAVAEINPLRALVVLLIAFALAMLILMRRWTSQLIAVSVVGFLITFYYVLFRAPDLAMTQILVESATLLLVLLLLSRFPRSAELSEASRVFSFRRQTLNLVISVGMGLLMTMTALMAMRHKHAMAAGGYYIENTVPLAHGANAVNTILVDFRGFDTLLEITVLVIACLGGLGLLMRYRRTEAEYAAGEMGPAGYGVSHPKTTKEKKEP